MEKERRGALIAACVFVAAAAAFTAIAWGVSTGGWTAAFDESAAAWFRGHRTATGVEAMEFVSNAHSPGMIGVWSAAFAAALALRGEKAWLVTLALALGGGMLLNEALKLTFHRARPIADGATHALASYGFPSGHTADSAVFYGTLAAFTIAHLRHPAPRAAAAAGAIAAVALVAASRLYLDVHYLSDVAAAACSSTMWLVLCLSRKTSPREAGRGSGA